jgi:hypothetical protein
VAGAVAPDHAADGRRDDAHVEAHRAVVDVPRVHVKLVVPGQGVASVGLDPPGDGGPYLVAACVGGRVAPRVPRQVPSGYFINLAAGPRRIVPQAVSRDRARRMLRRAARTNNVVHYWTHPENIAAAPETLTLLRGIVEDVSRLRDAGRCTVLTQEAYCRTRDPELFARAAPCAPASELIGASSDAGQRKRNPHSGRLFDLIKKCLDGLAPGKQGCLRQDEGPVGSSA